MSCDLCRRPLEDLAALAEAEPDRLLERVRGCGECARRAQLVLTSLVALRSAEPTGNDLVRRGNIDAAMRRAALHPPKAAGRSRLVFPSFAFAVLLAAVFVLVMRLRPPKDTLKALIIDGELTADTGSLVKGSVLPADARLAVHGDAAEIRLPDGSDVVAHAGSVFRSTPAKAHFTVENGALSFRVNHRPKGVPFVVETGEAKVRVVGTRFVVTRSRPGHTEVNVLEGIVEVTTQRTGAVRRLTANESADVDESEPPQGTPSAPSATPDAPPAEAAPEAASGKPREPAPVRASDIRARLRAGKVSEARALLAAARSSPINAAELGVLEAEVALAEGRHAEAVDAYLRVSRQYPRSSQAEEALFAAAQLTVDRGGRARGRELLQEYVRRYPRGRFLNEAERLLDVSSPSTPR